MITHSGVEPSDDDAAVLAYAKRGLIAVCASLPHLSGLAWSVRLEGCRSIETIAVTPSGRLLLHPQWLLTLDIKEASFVLAHELLHLAFDTHARGGDCNRLAVNVAHDWIINDILCHELDLWAPPAGGLCWKTARHESLEALLLDFRLAESEWRATQAQAPEEYPFARAWSGVSGLGGRPKTSALVEALYDAGIPRPVADIDTVIPESLDVIDDATEQRLFPRDSPAARRRWRQHIQHTAAQAEAQRTMHERMRVLAGYVGRTDRQTGADESLVDAQRARWVPPWELALQRWLDSLAPGARSYTRPSRRGADRTDVVLAGRLRGGWTLHVVLDTSGSMESDLPYLLGQIALFASASGVADVHLVQCDAQVSVEEWVSIEELASYRIAGYGASDLSPALELLAHDSEVEAVLVLTDGDVDYPQDPPPYRVLWAVLDFWGFSPGYGEVVRIDLDSVVFGVL